MKWHAFPAIMALVLMTIVFRQDARAQDSCPQLVQAAYDTTQEVCESIGDDEACYGNFTIEAQPLSLNFDDSGDIVSVEEIDSLRLSSMDVAAQEWGISVMHVQALVEGALAPQTAELVLFGNVEIANAAEEGSGFAPMQAFTFVSGVDDRPCEEAPDSGIMIQTPAGAGEITLLVNEVTIDLGSTAFLQAQQGDEMAIHIVEGQGHITSGGARMTVPAGSWASVPLSEEGLAEGAPEGPLPYDESEMQVLPVTLLGEQIVVAPPLRAEGFVAQTIFPGLHEVQPGETLFRIALQYNLPYDLVAAANGITNPDLVFVGQVLVIPPPDFPIPVPPLPIPQDEISTEPEIVTDLPTQPIGIVNDYTPAGGSPEDNECNPGGTMHGHCFNDEHYNCGWMMARYNRGIISLAQVLPESCRPPILPPPLEPDPDPICTTDSLGITTCVFP